MAKYLYNSLENGAPIQGFLFNQKAYSHPVGRIIQYEDDLAESLLSTFLFLEDLTPADVKAKLDQLAKKDKEFKCEFCDFQTDTKIAILGHSRTHKNEVAAKEEAPAFDPALVSQAEGRDLNISNDPYIRPQQRSVTPNFVSRQVIDETENNPSFYGDGFQEQKGS